MFLGNKLVRLWVIVMVLFATNMAQADEVENIPQQCSIDCQTPYGARLGSSPSGIIAHSNCSSDCVIYKPNYHNDIYTGIKWQCVEYARRWLLRNVEVVFGDVDVAADIWKLETVINPISKQTYIFESIVNGAKALPAKGDLLIYGKEYLSTGHVAVVIDVDKDKSLVHVAEQNYHNSKWQDDFARSISYVERLEQYWLLDAYLIGWKRVLSETHGY